MRAAMRSMSSGASRIDIVPVSISPPDVSAEVDPRCALRRKTGDCCFSLAATVEELGAAAT